MCVPALPGRTGHLCPFPFLPEAFPQSQGWGGPVGPIEGMVPRAGGSEGQRPPAEKTARAVLGGWARQGCGAVWLLPMKMPVSPGCPPALPGHRAEGLPAAGGTWPGRSGYTHTLFIFIF